MVSDSISASIPSVPKDFGKKKRANRSAKLKQCKLDARREQWLSQGAVKDKGPKEVMMRPRGSHQIHANGCQDALENLQMRGRGGELGEENETVPIHHDFDLDSPTNSPASSSILGGNDSGANFTASSSGSSSSGSSVGCCSGSISEEDEEGDDNCLDDWETMADALAATDDNNKIENHNDDNNPCYKSQSSPECELVPLDCSSHNLGSNNKNWTQERRVSTRGTPGNSRAWRPDDALRPQSLPNLSKQRSFPNADRHYGQRGLVWGCASGVNVPSLCPICTEDLDFTDTSFLPCSCGFQVCLFCHKKMLELDGRCPNCRKLYENDPVEVEASVHGGNLTLRLGRSCSMRS